MPLGSMSGGKMQRFQIRGRTHLKLEGAGRSVVGICLATSLCAGTALADGRPTLFPATQRYRASSPSAATGRSGSAELSVRALLDKAGLTEVEVTTGALDSAAAAPGNLSQVQFEAFDSSGELRYTKNFNHLNAGGSADFTFDDLLRGQVLQVQANVRGIDGARTDVVTVRETVKLRPDIAVQRISAPSSVAVGAAVNLSAVLAELNGDVGAHTDCVLSVDGMEVDRAPGIWIDAGSSVSCAFTYRFEQVGTRMITVSAVNVVPADYDLSNNSASATVEVISPVSFHYAASVSSFEVGSFNLSEGWYAYPGATFSSGSDFSYLSTSQSFSEQASFWGDISTQAGFPLTVSAFEQSDGAQTGAFAFDIAAPDFAYHADWAGGFFDQACVWRFDPVSYAHLNLCSTNYSGDQHTVLSYNRYAGEVTYFSSSYTRYWTRDYLTGQETSSSWSWNYGGQYANGAQRWAVGATYGFDVSVSSGGATYRAAPVFATTPFEWQTGQPRTCRDYNFPSYQSHFCFTYNIWERGASGYVSGETP